jgi:hypothetical protein
MNQDSKYLLFFSPEVEGAISELLSRYHLEFKITTNLFDMLKQREPKTVIFRLAGKILNQEGNFTDISTTLQETFHMKPEDANALAQDIKDEIVIPFAEIIEEEPIIEPKTETMPRPYDKKIEIKDVDENARKMHEILETTEPEAPRPDDKYREGIE